MSTTFHSVSNNAQGELSTAIDADDTTIVLDTGDGASFPSSNFWISINDEIIEISSRTGDTLTAATRGDQSTTNVPHFVGDTVSLFITAEQISELQTVINTNEDDIVTLEGSVADIEDGTTTLTSITTTGAATIGGTITAGSGDEQLSNAAGKLLQSALEQNSAGSGDVLTWNGSAWAPATPGSGGASNLDGLSDVTISAAASAQTLINDGSGQFVNRSISGDITISNTGVATIANDAITTGKIAAGAVGTTDIADSAITSAKIANGTIVAGDIADGAITSAKILDGTIATADIADSAITSAKIANGTIVAADLASNTLTATQIAADAIGSSELADNAVDTAAIADNAVTAAKLNHLHTFSGGSYVAYGVEVDDQGRITDTADSYNDGVFTASNQDINTDGTITIDPLHRIIVGSIVDGSDPVTLHTISGGQKGQVIILNPFHSDQKVIFDIIIDHMAGNIYCPGEVDITLDTAGDAVTMFYDGSKWRVTNVQI
jgi:hypothetical protein